MKVLKAWRVQRASLSLDFSRVDAVVFGTLDGRPAIRCRCRRCSAVESPRRAGHSEPKPCLTSPCTASGTHTQRCLLEAGEHPKVVQERLGHTTITTTMDIYSHVTPTMQRTAVERFVAAVSRP